MLILFLLFFFLDGPKKTDNEDDIYGGSTDDESGEPNQNDKTEKVSSPLTPKETSSSDRDTEDELKRFVRGREILWGLKIFTHLYLGCA